MRSTRRDFLTQSMLAAACLATAERSWAAGPATVELKIAATHPVASIPQDFLGLGYEISSVAVQGLLTRENSDYVRLLRTLGSEGVVRIGGNTSDNQARYAAETPARSGPSGTIVNDAVLQDLGGFLDAAGWKLIWGLNLGSGSEKDMLAEARAVQRAVGPSLLAFEIGNEPDLFAKHHRKAGYGYEDWLKEFVHARDALRKGMGKDVPLAGPDAAGDTSWVTRFAHDEGKHVRLLTEHYYRGGEKDPDTTIAKMLGPDPKLNSLLSKLHAAADSSGVPFRICEVNSFSGGGRPGVSDTLASALWVLDFMYTVAAHGGAGVNIETGVNQLGVISAYSPIANNPAGKPEVRPEYYGMLAFAAGGKGDLVSVEKSVPTPGFSAYATRQMDGKLHLTLVNKTATAVEVNAQFSGANPQGSASVIRLAGPSLSAKTGVALGGAMVSDLGEWQTGTEQFLPVSGGAMRVPVPGGSAAVVALH